MQKEGGGARDDDESEGGRREGRGRRGSVGGRRVDGGRLRVVWNDQIATDIVDIWNHVEDGNKSELILKLERRHLLLENCVVTVRTRTDHDIRYGSNDIK